MAQKYPLPRTQTMINKMKRYQQLYLIVDQTVEEMNEMNQLQIDLSEYMINPSDFNGKVEQSALTTLNNEFATVKDNLNNHLSSLATNVHTKSQVGLGKVENLNATEIRTATDKEFRVETRTSDPTSPAVGRMWFRSDI